MTDNQLKEAELIELGNDAETLLTNQTFSTTVDGLVRDTFSFWTASKPDEAADRETHYQMYRGLVGIVHTLQQRVAVRDQILADNENSDNDGE